MLCESPIRHGDRKGQLATGTAAGYQRHYQANEPPCDECREFIRTNRPSWYDHVPLGSVDRICERCEGGYKSGPNSNYRFCPDCRSVAQNEQRRDRRNRPRPCNECGGLFRPIGQPFGSCDPCRELKRITRQTAKTERELARVRRLVEQVGRHAERELARASAAWVRTSVQDFKRRRAVPVRYVNCASCDDLFVARSPNAKYCSVPGCGRRRQVSLYLRAKVIRRDNGVCLICQGMTDPTDFVVVEAVSGPNVVVGPNYPTVDHITPRSVGGSDDLSNLRAAHHRCNSSRGDALGEQLSWAV